MKFTLLGGRSLHRRVCLSRDLILGGQEPRVSARVSRLRSRRGRQSAESRRARQYRANLRQYLCGAIFQYRIFGDAVATSWWAKVPRLVPKRDRPLGLGLLVDLASSDRAQAKPSTVR